MVATFRTWLAVAAFGLSACVSQPDNGDDPTKLSQRVTTPVPKETAVKSAKTTPQPPAPNREKLAALYMEQGRYADALLQWKILQTLHPDDERYERQVEQTKEHIDKLAGQRYRLGIAALEKGDIPGARHELLATLALDPTHTAALENLRRTEFDRVWRIQTAKLEKLKTAEDRKAPNVGEQERSYFELGTQMLREGDYPGAVREIQKYLNSYPNDVHAKKLISEAYAKLAAQQQRQGLLHNALGNIEQAKRFNATSNSKTEKDVRSALANDYYEKGLRTLRHDLKVAIEMFNKALEYNPQHAKAREKLTDAQRMQKKLEEIGK